MTWAAVAILVIAAIAVGYFVYVGKIFREKEYLADEEKRRQDEERKASVAKAKQEEREIRHEKRLREIDDARRDPAEYERLLNSWPDDPENQPPVSTGNGAGGSARGNMH